MERIDSSSLPPHGFLSLSFHHFLYCAPHRLRSLHRHRQDRACRSANIAIIAHVDHGKTTLVTRCVSRGVPRHQQLTSVMTEPWSARGITTCRRTPRRWATPRQHVDTPGTPTSAAKWSAFCDGGRSSAGGCGDGRAETGSWPERWRRPEADRAGQQIDRQTEPLRLHDEVWSCFLT